MAVLSVAALSCTKDVSNQPAPEKEQVAMSFDATIGTPTKVEIASSETEEGVTTHKLNWSVGDKIKVYSKNSDSHGIEFTTDISSPSATASFEGTIEAADAYYAFYPSSVSAQWVDYNSFFSVNLPENQKPSGVSSVYAIAKADGSSLQFKHATGFVKFTIPDEYADRIAKVTFSGNDSEKLAGWLHLDPNNTANNNFNEGHLTYSEISLSPSTGGTFAAGTYYLMSFPATFANGITMRFTDAEGFVATKTSSNTTEIKAGGILDVGTMSGLTFVGAYKHSLPWTEDFSSYKSANYQTIGDVTITNEKYAGGTAPELYVPDGASFSFRIDVKDKDRALTLSFNHRDTNYNGNFTISLSEGATLTEQGRAASKSYYTLHLEDATELVTVTLTASGRWGIRLDDFELVQGTILPQIMSFSQQETQAMVGKSFTPPTLNGAETTVTYTSSNTDVAEVNASTGAVTIKAAGKTTITADAVATDDYFAGTASYVINVSALVVGYSYTFTENIFGGTYTNSAADIRLFDANDNLVVWKFSATPYTSGFSVANLYNETKGQGFGADADKTTYEANPRTSCKEITLSTDGDNYGHYENKVEKIVLNVCGGGGKVKSDYGLNSQYTDITVTVNGVQYGATQTSPENPTDLTFACPEGTEPQSGEIVIYWKVRIIGGQASVIYLKSIQIHDYQ